MPAVELPMSPRRFARITAPCGGWYYRYTPPNFLATRNNIEPEGVQAKPSKKRRSPFRRVSAAFNATAINTYTVLIGICVTTGVLVLQCGQIAEADTDTIGPPTPDEDVCCALESTEPRTPLRRLPHRNMIGALVGN